MKLREKHHWRKSETTERHSLAGLGLLIESAGTQTPIMVIEVGSTGLMRLLSCNL